MKSPTFNTFGFGIGIKKFTLDMRVGFDSGKVQLGGDITINPMAPHPKITLRVYLLLVWLTVSIYYCDHED